MAISGVVTIATSNASGFTWSSVTPDEGRLVIEPRPAATLSSTGREPVSDRLAYLRQHFEMQWFS